MNTPRPTPETDAAVDDTALEDKNQPHTDWVTAHFARSLERQRDEALSKLSTVYRWIERNHPDGFIDSQSHLQNLERVADAWYDKLEAMRSERDQLSRDLSSLLAGDCLDGHDAIEGARNGIAMRNRLRALEWRPTAESLPTEDDANEYGDVEWSDGKDIWQGGYDNPNLATHWRPITFPNAQ